ncbi:hypothetical protein [Streptomyces justiciae]|uniref:hypothetical protein n=1 Tax=Streptomyces justiciae TaxID=2780140 RepID=UPI00187E669C|nr:hypothetical protein [Streptomyces justiciae]MBE8476790.1 hypothetical protein [Streptomyces justiciae]
MTGLLAELGRKLAERWLSLLVLPGALFLGTLAAGRELGHARWYAVGELPARLNRHGDALAGSTAGLLLFLCAFLLAAAACGLAAQALGSLVERLWLADGWQGWPRVTHGGVRRLVARRGRRFADRQEAAGVAEARAELLTATPDDAHRAAVATARLHRLADAPPARPTWTGDRLHAVAGRLEDALGVEIAVVWPHLWLHAPEPTRTEITAAREAMLRAAGLAGWGLLYVAVAVVWWPGALIAGAVLLAAWHRYRAATDAYALLVESAVRLHAQELAARLGIGRRGPLTKAHGRALTAYLSHGQEPPPELLLPAESGVPEPR